MVARPRGSGCGESVGPATDRLASFLHDRRRRAALIDGATSRPADARGEPPGHRRHRSRGRAAAAVLGIEPNRAKLPSRNHRAAGENAVDTVRRQALFFQFAASLDEPFAGTTSIVVGKPSATSTDRGLALITDHHCAKHRASSGPAYIAYIGEPVADHCIERAASIWVTCR